MEITNGRNNGFIDVCGRTTKAYRNDVFASGKLRYGEA